MSSSFRDITAKLSVASASSKVVDLSQKTATAKIVREGFDVPAVALDQRKVDQLVGGLVVAEPSAVPRVVSQSIAPGTLVARGAAVNLVLAPRTKIPLEIFTDIHLDLKAKTVEDIQPLLANAAVRKSLLSNASSSTLSESEATTLKAAFNESGIGVDDTDPGKTFEKAFQSARGALAFQ